MASFDLAWPVLLAHEGGRCNVVGDHGGETAFGITLGWLQGVQPGATVADIRGMTVARASDLYHRFVWTPLRLDEVEDQVLATKLLDVAVNMGSVRAVKLLQEACGCLGQVVAMDGHLGPQTLRTANSLDPQALVAKLCDLQARRYQAIAQADPSQTKFLKGWLRRAEWPTTEAA